MQIKISSAHIASLAALRLQAHCQCLLDALLFFALLIDFRAILLYFIYSFRSRQNERGAARPDQGRAQSDDGFWTKFVKIKTKKSQIFD